MNPTTHPSTNGSYAIACTMTHEAAAMERLCQVIRIRGFRIVQMAVDAAGEQLNIAMTLEGTRPISMLKSQLEKLHTVAEVVLQEPMARTKTA
ncbi:ACT domain-containing protein [Marinobacter salinisoli]|uniref:ACT domain-containing protein n=1 Tax=Marinobacter salinisoli TaxID=2769486 RepID=A0ABX7MPP8_9GAMM|nr:ACT domain-containing protein [Marinobacter salinisoli]QSP93344.1 ACT domain-containing protein [Marinobacter salinisoli]